MKGLCSVSPKTSYRLDNRHGAGDTKNSGEKQVIVGQRKTTTKPCEQGKRDQVPQGWRHIHTASDLNCVKGAQRKRPDPPTEDDGPGLVTSTV